MKLKFKKGKLKKEWDEFLEYNEGENIFVMLLNIFISIGYCLVLTCFPAFIILTLFVPIIGNTELALLWIHYLPVVVVSLAMPQFFFIFTNLQKSFYKWKKTRGPYTWLKR